MYHSEHHVHILELLDGLRFPATKADIILHAEKREASEDALDLLRGIPEDDYKNREELMNNINVIEDLPGHENLWSSSEANELFPENGEGEQRDVV